MPLTQTQIIQSLGEALAWFEKELAWGVNPGELRHLTGRIGELYASMMTRGQMALETNQRGYDVISADNERVSVKTVTSSNHVNFNRNTFGMVDRVIILRINADGEDGVSVETLLDCSAEQFLEQYGSQSETLVYPVSTRRNPRVAVEELAIVKELQYGRYCIRQYENATVSVLVDGMPQLPAKPQLRTIADELHIDLLNGNSNPKNTRQLGADIISVLESRQSGANTDT